MFKFTLNTFIHVFKYAYFHCISRHTFYICALCVYKI